MSRSNRTSTDELLKEMSATRKAIALYLQRLSIVEEKVDRFTYAEEQRHEQEKIRGSVAGHDFPI